MNELMREYNLSRNVDQSHCVGSVGFALRPAGHDDGDAVVFDKAAVQAALHRELDSVLHVLLPVWKHRVREQKRVDSAMQVALPRRLFESRTRF
jgi:hypothetical protein